MSEAVIIETEKSVLSSECRLHKTERFIKETNNFKDVDVFLSKIAESVILTLLKTLNTEETQANGASGLNCYKLETEDKEHAFLFVFGCFLESGIANKKDIIFFKYSGKEAFIRRNDPRLSDFLKEKAFLMLLERAVVTQSSMDFRKLYRLSNADYVNFPLLNDAQKRLVAIEDSNVLVQGVAGSGKTNVCIDKIIFSACRAYSGRVLYSTFSRGLLIDTQSKVKLFRNNLKGFVADYESGRVIFADGNHKKAIENKLGVYFSVDDDDKVCQKIIQIIAFLDGKVDYFLLEDFYTKYISETETVVDESFFVKKYVSDIKNHQLAGKLAKVASLSYEVIYKEIFGVILGCYDLGKAARMLSPADYAAIRKESFTVFECEVIHSLARDYDAYLRKNNLVDNNLIARRLLEKTDIIGKYSLAVLDEVQDMTEVNLCFMRSIAAKLFCVGDALQMINPSYFSFAYLKRLLFEKDIVTVTELSNNYRNTKRISDIIESLGQINMRQFGTHSFVLKGTSVDSDVPTSTVYVNDADFLDAVNKENCNNYTVVVSGIKEKERLRRYMHKQEILTVAEIKGLEREIVILYNVLSANIDKWNALERIIVNRKQADENSVYRYYFNLFYVGISRAKTHIYVAESQKIPAFENFFKNGFTRLSKGEALSGLLSVMDKTEVEQDEIFERVGQFINLGQFDNARFAADKILAADIKAEQLNKIDIYQAYISHGKHREAGIRFWESGMFADAKAQFNLSGDEMLCRLIDACSDNDSGGLGIDILSFLPEFENNEPAKALIMQVVKKDLESLTSGQRLIRNNLRKIKERLHG